MRELLGNRPAHVPTGIGNAGNDIDTSLLDAGKSEPEIEIKEDASESGTDTGGEEVDELETDEEASLAKATAKFDAAAAAAARRIAGDPASDSSDSDDEYTEPTTKGKEKGKAGKVVKTKEEKATKAAAKKSTKKTAAGAAISVPAVKAEGTKKSRNQGYRLSKGKGSG